MKQSITLTVEYIDHTHIRMVNKNGDTYTSKSEELMDFLANAGEETKICVACRCETLLTNFEEGEDRCILCDVFNVDKP